MPKLLASIGVGGAGSSLLVRDEFDDTNGVVLPSHAIAPINTIAAAWQFHTRDWVINSNVATAGYLLGGAANKFDAISDGIVSASFSQSTNSGSVAIYFRGDSALSAYWAVMYDRNDNSVGIVEYPGGVLRTYRNVSRYGVYTLKAEFRGSLIVAQMVEDGVPMIYTSTSKQSQTWAGAGAGTYPNASMHTFELWS